MSTALATQNGNLAVAQADFTAQQIDLIRHAIVPGANEMEFDLFLNLCKAKRLDPLTRQIYGIKTSKGLQMFASIDGLRVIAQRSGQYAGQVGPFWCGEDGTWQDVWLSTGKPAAAKIGVLRKGWTEPMWGVATLKSYGKDSPTWNAMPDVMLAKVAESMALRKAFPDDLSGLYERSEFREVPEEAETSPAPSRRSEKPTARAEATPVPAEVVTMVDESTGEIRPVFDPETATPKQIAEEIIRLRDLMGMTPADLRTFAQENNLNGRARLDQIRMVAALNEMLDSEYADEDDPAQGTLLDAETKPIDRWANN